jgi:hypothetical protein
MRSDLSGQNRNRLYQTEAMPKPDRAETRPGRHLNAEIAEEKTQRRRGDSLLFSANSL